jgi:choline dehydrogenase-like flavoprotein
VRRQDDAPHSGSAERFVAGVKVLGLDRPPNLFGVVEANISGCVGCGLCNIGCAYGAKHSMLDFVLPQGQQRFGERLQVISEAQAQRIRVRRGRATGVECQDSDGGKLRIEAETVIVSAGALHSSTLLQRSGLGGPHVGRALHHNVAVPLMAEFDQQLDCYDGLQISHFLQPPPARGFILESWAQPLATYGTVLNGWFEDHFETMSNYRRLGSAGVVVGTTDSRSWVRHSRLAGRPTFAFRAGPRDVGSLVAGSRQLGEIFFAAGARRLIPATFSGEPIHSEAELSRFGEQIQNGRDLVLSTAHPQGGNPIGTDPRRAVVDERFRVHGIGNLHVCDASVFPSAVGVNPQLTVMALAEYAAPLIA